MKTTLKPRSENPFKKFTMNRFHVRFPDENPKQVQKKVEEKPVLCPVPLTYIPPAEFWAQYNFFRQQYLTQVLAPNKPEINLELELRCGPPPDKHCRELLPVKAAHGGNNGGAYSGSGFRVKRAPKRYAPYPIPDYSKSLQLFPPQTELPAAMGGANAGSGEAGEFQATRASEGNAGWSRGGGVGAGSTRVTHCKKPDWTIKL